MKYKNYNIDLREHRLKLKNQEGNLLSFVLYLKSKNDEKVYLIKDQLTRYGCYVSEDNVKNIIHDGMIYVDTRLPFGKSKKGIKKWSDNLTIAFKKIVDKRITEKTIFKL
jgi:hypothetical protein